jgi:hypothetical protein
MYLSCNTDEGSVAGSRSGKCGGESIWQATRLYNKHCKYLEQWNPWHPIRSAHNFQLAQSVSQETKTLIDHDLRHGLDDFNIESFQPADALLQLLSGLDFGLRNDIEVEAQSAHPWNSILQEYIVMYTVAFDTSPISGAP